MLLLLFIPYIIFNFHDVFMAFITNINTFIPVREIEDMGRACSVFHGQNGPIHLLPVNKNDDEYHKILLLEIILL